jgi:hypothetical protein
MTGIYDMRLVELSDVAGLSDGEIVPAVKAVVKAVFPPRTGQGKHGEWRVQNAILTQNGTEVRASFWGIDVSDLKGKEVCLQSQAGKRGLEGIKVKLNDQKGENELSITDKVRFDGPNAGTAPSSSKTSASASPQPIVATDVDGVRKRAMQLANLYLLAHRAAKWVKDDNPEVDLPAATATLFIALNKGNLENAMPTCPLDQAPKAAASSPKKEKEPLFAEEELTEDDVKW